MRNSRHPARLPIIAALFLWIIAALCRGDALALQPSREYTQTPEQANMAYIDVGFDTSDGVTLHGWFLPFQDPQGNPDFRPGPVVILPPPDEGNMGNMLWHYFRFFRGAPWHVLLFDWRGFGTSDPWPIEPGAVIDPGFVDDLHAAIEFVKTRPEWDQEHIGIYAFNVGAAASLAAVSTREDIDCLAIRGVYTNQRELVAQVQSADSTRTVVAHPRYPGGLEPLAVAPSVKVPTWIIAGSEDRFTTPDMARRVYDALGGKRQYWEAPGAGHTGNEMPEAVQIEQFTGRLHAFLRRYLGVGRF